MFLKIKSENGWVLIGNIDRIDYQDKPFIIQSPKEYNDWLQSCICIPTNYYLIKSKEERIEITPDQLVQDYNYIPFNLIKLKFFNNESDRTVLFNGAGFIYNDAGSTIEVIKAIRVLTVDPKDIMEKGESIRIK